MSKNRDVSAADEIKKILRNRPRQTPQLSDNNFSTAPIGCLPLAPCSSSSSSDGVPLEHSFHAAQAASRSNRLLSGTQWGGNYLEQLNVKVDSRENIGRDINTAVQLIDEEPTQQFNESPNAPNAKIYLLENSAASTAPRVTEVGELPPRCETWDLPCYFAKPPKRVLIVKRTYTPLISAVAVILSALLTTKWKVQVLAEPAARIELEEMGAPPLWSWPFSIAKDNIASSSNDLGAKWISGDVTKIDLVVSIGGDGTILWVSNLFPEVVPPVLAIGMGSLGYLTQFDIREMISVIESILSLHVFRVQLRARLHCILLDSDGITEKAIFNCVNDTVVDRGAAPSLTTLDVFVNGSFFTTVSADGLIIATPTGSTAYSMSAGGSMVHPCVPCIIFTPICPHSLSMRPLIFPDSSTIKLTNPSDARSSVWVSFDGRNRTQVRKGQSVVISLSSFPFPLIRKTVPNDSWLQALNNCLNFNARIRQRDHIDDSSQHHTQQQTTSTIIESHPQSLFDKDCALLDELPECMSTYWKEHGSKESMRIRQASQSLHSTDVKNSTALKIDVPSHGHSSSCRQSEDVIELKTQSAERDKKIIGIDSEEDSNLKDESTFNHNDDFHLFDNQRGSVDDDNFVFTYDTNSRVHENKQNDGGIIDLLSRFLKEETSNEVISSSSSSGERPQWESDFNKNSLPENKYTSQMELRCQDDFNNNKNELNNNNDEFIDNEYYCCSPTSSTHLSSIYNQTNRSQQIIKSTSSSQGDDILLSRSLATNAVNNNNNNNFCLRSVGRPPNCASNNSRGPFVQSVKNKIIATVAFSPADTPTPGSQNGNSPRLSVGDNTP